LAIDDVYGMLIIDDALGAYGNEAKKSFIYNAIEFRFVGVDLDVLQLSPKVRVIIIFDVGSEEDKAKFKELYSTSLVGLASILEVK